MVVFKIFTIFTCATLVVSESKFVETINKCSINDGKCLTATVHSALQHVGENGIPELNIPPLDPLEFKNISVSILDMIDLTAINGKVKGVKNCEVDSIKTDVKKGHSKWKITCTSVVVKVHYILNGSNPLLTSILGGDSVHGAGKAKMKFEKIRFTFDYFFIIEKRSDGELYFTWTTDKIIYKFAVPGKVTFAAEKVFVGETDATAFVVSMLNENASVFVESYGKLFLDKAMEYVYEYATNFCNKTPIKYLITDDLSAYANN